MSLKVRRFWILTAVCAFFFGAGLAIAFHQESTAERIEASRLAGVASNRVQELFARRIAGFGKAGAMLTTVFYTLSLGVLLAPGPIRLACGNVAVFLSIIVLIDVFSNLLGFHSPALGTPGQAVPFSIWVYDETKGWFHAASAIGETGIGRGDRFPVRINELGLRGPEVRLQRAEGHGRVLVFGDSYVFGVGVAEEHLLTTRLGRMLAPYFPSGVEVVNMGVVGYSTDQEFLLWQELGRRLSPDGVILVLCDNDYVGNTEDFAYRQYYKPYFELEPAGELRLRNVPVPRLSRVQRAKLWLGQESNVWNFVRNRKADNGALRSFLNELEVDVPRRPKARYRTTAALVKSFAREVATRNSWFLVTSAGRRGEDPKPFQNLSRSLEREAIHHLDLLPILEAARRGEPHRAWDFRFDPHWNRDAHELAALSIFEYVRDHYLRAKAIEER